MTSLSLLYSIALNFFYSCSVCKYTHRLHSFFATLKQLIHSLIDKNTTMQMSQQQSVVKYVKTIGYAIEN